MSASSSAMETEEVNHVSDDEASHCSSSRSYTLYFIRHAEALHNQLEKKAMAEALALAISQGHAPDSAHAKAAKETARRAVLESEGMADPPLSDAGFEEARNAKRALECLMETYGLPKVEEVWVSPLQRTLQTAATIFPESSPSSSPSNDGPVIRVKKELEERRTGLSCDTHSPVENIRKRRTFMRFSLSSLQPTKSMRKVMEGIQEAAKEDEAGDGGAVWEDKTESVSAAPEGDKAAPVEEKHMLRERTKKLFELLADTNSRNICLIGHKGYLRELERGPLGKADAELFSNCEVRVYRLHLDVGSSAENVGVDDVLVGGCENGSEWCNKVGSLSEKPVAVLQRADKIASSGK